MRDFELDVIRFGFNVLFCFRLSFRFCFQNKFLFYFRCLFFRLDFCFEKIGPNLETLSLCLLTP